MHIYVYVCLYVIRTRGFEQARHFFWQMLVLIGRGATCSCCLKIMMDDVFLTT